MTKLQIMAAVSILIPVAALAFAWIHAYYEHNHDTIHERPSIPHELIEIGTIQNIKLQARQCKGCGSMVRNGTCIYCGG